MSNKSVAIEDGIPTVKTERTFSVLGSPLESLKRSTVSACSLRIVTVKKAHAQQLEISVATPTPSTSYPLGNRTIRSSQIERIRHVVDQHNELADDRGQGHCPDGLRHRH